MTLRAEDLPANWDLTLAHRSLGKDSDLDRNVLLTLIGRPQRFSDLEPLLRGRGKNNLTQVLARLESEALIQGRLAAVVRSGLGRPNREPRARLHAVPQSIRRAYESANLPRLLLNGFRPAVRGGSATAAPSRQTLAFTSRREHDPFSEENAVGGRAKTCAARSQRPRFRLDPGSDPHGIAGSRSGSDAVRPYRPSYPNKSS